MLVYFDPWYAGIVLPLTAVGGLMAIPYLDFNKQGNGYYTIEQRTRETAIRKVLGASPTGLATRIAAEFGGLILVGSAVAAPIVFWIVRRWLDNFAFRIELTADLFVVPCLLALAMVAMTISYNTIRASIQDPALALRDE